MNLSANPANGTDTIPSDFFADRDVRLAFAYAYNLQSSIDELYQDRRGAAERYNPPGNGIL